MLPSDVSRLVLERVDVSHPVWAAVITPEDDELPGDDRIPVKLGALPTVVEGVVLPTCLAGPPVDSVDETVTGADDYEVPRDRGRREDSATGLVLP